MIKKIFAFFIASAIILGVGYTVFRFGWFQKKDTLQTAFPQQILAIYDVGTNRILQNKDSIVHYTLVCANEAEQFIPKKEIQQIQEKNQPVFINLQIGFQKIFKQKDENELSPILNGSFDKKLISLLSVLGKSSQAVYLRYNAEMELPQSTYPWQNKSAMEYIRSFRRIALLCKKYAPAVKIV